MKRFLCFFLILLFLTGCTYGQKNEENTNISFADKEYKLSTAVVYYSRLNENIYDYLQQSLVLNLTAEKLSADSSDFSNYDILYLDSSVKNTPNAEEFIQKLLSFVENGGALYVDNSLYDFVPKQLLGAKDFIKITECPVNLTLTETDEDLSGMQEIISDFSSLYPSYSDYAALSQMDYGYAMITDTAKSLANWQDYALYTINSYGKGVVLFSNPLLPNNYNLSSFSMDNADNLAFSSTTASCSQLFVNDFASYVSKKIYGYSLSRVYGSFGRPSMSWELHYEEITGFENNSIGKFTELCEDKLQIPSITLIRNTYWWFNRAETVTYLLNQNNEFLMDYNESAYSSGTHIDSNNQWLTQTRIEDGGSYFTDYPEYNNRAYATVLDYNSDSNADILSGSSDGKIYYYEGKGFKDRLYVGYAQTLKDKKTGEDIVADGGFSAPCFVDLNNDNYLDLVVGDATGTVKWYKGNGSINFEFQGILLDSDFNSQALPAFGDINEDNIPDLVLGSNAGIMIIFYGQMQGDVISYNHENMVSLTKQLKELNLGNWLAPTITDLDNDGELDLAIGTFDGYVAKFNGVDDFSGYVELNEMNYKGNYNAKFGNYCNPNFYDLNGDGSKDIICGMQEYGVAYPIDDEHFQFKDELQAQIDKLNEDNIYIGVHFYTNAYASEQRENFELEAHKKALQSYNIDTSKIGVNQHTWYTSSLSTKQSFLSAYNAGFLWNSGFTPPAASWKAPQIAAENVISLPFFLMDNDEKTILIQNNSVLPYADTASISAKYDMPVCVYYHCDFVYESDAEAIDYINKTDEFRYKYKYNFCGEHQLMFATAAASNLEVDVQTISDKQIKITPKQISQDFELYDENYQNSTGLKLEFKEGVDISKCQIDADVWSIENNAIYIGLNRPISVTLNAENNNNQHIEQINVPATVETNENGANIEFIEDGMMQVIVYGKAETSDKTWTVTEKDGYTMFTKYGDVCTLNIKYKGVIK